MSVKTSQLILVAPEFRSQRGPRVASSGLVAAKMAAAIFDTAGKDSSGVSNETVASHGTGVFIPTGAIVTRAWYQVKTSFTTASTNAGTIALTLQTAGDLVVGIAVSDGSNPWNAGLSGCLPGNPAEATVAGDTGILAAARMAATQIALTAEREIVVTVGLHALTAGKMVIFVEYVQGL